MTGNVYFNNNFKNIIKKIIKKDIMQNYKVYLLFLMVLLFSSCIKENESLVNPPPKSETVKVRFFNLAGDNSPKSLVLENVEEVRDLPYGEVSTAFQPSADSSSVEVKSGGNSVYKLNTRFKYSRNLNYTFAALPSSKGAANYKSCDTVVIIPSTAAKSLSTTSIDSYFKVLNAYPDSSCTFSIALGCPNGTRVGSYLSYRNYSAQLGVRSGNLTFSLVKTSNGSDEVIGLYEVSAAVQGQYLLVVKENSNGKPELALIDELNTTNGAMTLPKSVPERVSYFRTINLSRSSVEVDKVPGDVISSGVLPFSIDSYKNVPACTSINKDSIEILSGGNMKSKVSVSLEVLEKYSLIVMDSGSNRASNAVVASPVRLTQLQNGRAIVRVVNANYKHPGLNVSIGARDNGIDTSRGFTSGDAIASQVGFGSISEAALVYPGSLPVAAFSTDQPANFLIGANLNVEANKSYILIFGLDENDEDRFTLIEESTGGEELKYSTPSAFVQVVNAVPDVNQIFVNIPGLFSVAKLQYTSSLATLVPIGANTITINGKSTTFNAEANLRNLVVACGESNNVDIMNLQSPNMGATSSTFQRRFINASKDIAKLNVKSDETHLIYGDLGYMQVSPIETMTREKKFSLYYENAETKAKLVRIDDLFLNFGKNYSVIFVGNSRNSGYGVIVQQEY